MSLAVDDMVVCGSRLLTPSLWVPGDDDGPYGSYLAPSDVANLAYWFKPEAFASAADTDPISTWADASGNARDATQSLTARPLVKKAILNGYDVARFDGSNDYLDLPFLDLGADYTVIAVVRATTFAAGVNYRIWGSSKAADSAKNLKTLSIVNGASGLFTNYRDNAGGASTSLGGSTAISTWYVVSGRVSNNGVNTTALAALNGTDNAASTVAGISALSDNSKMGAFTTAGSTQGFFPGDIAEMAIYSTAIAAADKTSVQRGMGAKYGITVA